MTTDKNKISTSRTWAEINLNALEHNFYILKNLLAPNSKFAAVCKANAYGHGLVEIAARLQKLKADYICVASVQEAITLRENKITIPILCIGQVEPDLANLIAQYEITQAVGNFENAKLLSQYANKNNVQIKIHVKLDTGMGRLGFYWPDENSNYEDKLKTANEIALLCKLPNLEAEGLFTHFSMADENYDYTEMQFKKFKEAQKFLKELGINFKITHAAASSGFLSAKKFHLDMCRFGIA